MNVSLGKDHGKMMDSPLLIITFPLFQPAWSFVAVIYTFWIQAYVGRLLLCNKIFISVTFKSIHCEHLNHPLPYIYIYSPCYCV